VAAGPQVLAQFTATPSPVIIPDGVASFAQTAPANPANTTYTWLFGDGSPTTQGPSTSHTYTQPGTFTAQLVASLGTCADTATAIVTVQASGIFIPTVFTPNGDGINDVLTLVVPAGVSVRVKVYDRWGVEVAALNEPVWRPSSNLPEGVYVLHLEATLPNGTRLQRASSVTLIR
jgi:gliding motility-associated-like protein